MTALARMVEVAGGELRPRDGDRDPVVPDELFAVMLLWGVDDHRAWIGWLTTIERRSVAFCAEDLHDRAFQAWLAALPGWDAHGLAIALTTPGLHLVWRRADPIDDARPRTSR